MTQNFKESDNMQILEYGNSKNPKIILIHGLECPYQIWTDYINYKDEFKQDPKERLISLNISSK